jgi:hypothetical protein
LPHPVFSVLGFALTNIATHVYSRDVEWFGHVAWIIEVEVTTNGQSASLSWCQAPIWSPLPHFCFLSENCGFLDVAHPLWWENASVIYSYNCFWALPEQSLSGPSPVELMTIFYCLIWDSPNLESQVPVFISPRNKVVQLYPPGTGFPFRRLLRLAGLQRSILTHLHVAILCLPA